MIVSALILLVFQTADAQASLDPAQLELPSLVPEATIEKKIIYKKETTVDLSGTTVEGENQLPPAFFVTKMQTPGARSLLEERLKFGLRDYNHMGF